MSEKFKTFFRKIRIAGVVFTCFLGVSLFYIFSGNLTNIVGRYLHVLPSYLGGEVAGSVYDTTADDNGSGILVYPSNAAFENGAMDIIRYTVHEPVTQGKWQKSSEYWQLVLEYMNGPAKVRNTMIYIDLDNLEGGSTEPLFDAAENVTFDMEHPWDFAVWICGGQAKVYDSEKNPIYQTEYYEENGGKVIKIRIPLWNKNLQAVYASRKTYHYVITGGYSEFDRGGFMPIEKRRTLSRGGTKSSKDYNALIPKIYDILGDNAQLATWNKDEFTKAVIHPVEVEMHPYFGSGKPWHGEKSEQSEQAFINKVTEEYAKYAPNTEDMFANVDDSVADFKQKLKENPDDYVSMAYYGSCLAVQGGQASVIQAVALVNQAFEYLDKACELAKDKPEEIEVLANRASVAYSVPNDVFMKTETAVADFTRIISLYKNGLNEEELAKPENKSAVAYYYTMLYLCHQRLNQETQAVLALQEAKKLIEQD